MAKPKRKHATGTMDRLLDAAERLFGEHGYEGVGLRQLAREAGANLGAVTYHFGSKEALYLETFMRRFRPMQAERLQRLRAAQARANGRPLPVAVIVECLLRPPFETAWGNAHSRQFLARNMLLPPPSFLRAIRAGKGEFIAALKQSLPDVPEDLIALRNLFAGGTQLMFHIRSGKMPEMQNPEVREVVLQEMIRFVTAALSCAPATAPGKRPKLPPQSESAKK